MKRNKNQLSSVSPEKALNVRLRAVLTININVFVWTLEESKTPSPVLFLTGLKQS